MQNKSNSAFIEVLKARAKEQEKLSQQRGMPDALGFVNRWLAKDTIVKLSVCAFLGSLIVFTVFFQWFYLFEHLVAGK
jgi:hypothetical protein